MLEQREVREHNERVSLLRRLVAVRWHGIPQRRDEVSHLLLETCVRCLDDADLEILLAQVSGLSNPRIQ